uniref:DNA utilization protein GntX n=1 Tax=Candidatus Berkiella aquae TaxID=295108 RepID=A0A0Q9YFN1_9GAMM
MNKWLKIVQRGIKRCLQLPAYCLLCCQQSERDFALCLACEQKLPWLPQLCPRCAMPSHSDANDCICADKTLPYERLQALFDYAWPLNLFISQWKYGEQLAFAKMLAHFMVKRLTPAYLPDCVLAMPLHPKRLRQRGFNQSVELASQIAHALRVPLDRWSCTRVTHTVSQSQLTAQKRAKNIRTSTFHLKPNFQAKHVLVIDDVVTTGATISALSRCLKHQGVKTVEIWCCCRTLKNAKSI